MVFSGSDILSAEDVSQSTEDEPMVAIRNPTQIEPTRIRPKSGKPRVRVPENYWELVADYERHLRATNHADNTLLSYSNALKELANYLTQEGIGLHIEGIARAHLQGFMRDVMERRGLQASTARGRYNALHAFFAWLVSEDEIDASPMAKMHRPKVMHQPKSIVTDQQLARLLRTCAGRDFYERRDTAMIRVLLDTGVRISGLVDMQLDNLDLDYGTCQITSKRHTWVVGFSRSTIDALAAYRRVRSRHRLADLPALWLSQNGALNVRSVWGIIERRCVQAQIPHINPHRFRHTFARAWLADGGQEGDLAELGGWSDTRMIHEVYAKDGANDRAIAAHKDRRLGDRV